MKPECTILQLPPDLPIFIRPQGDDINDYYGEWIKFVRLKKDSEFFVSPKPAYARDTVLTQEKVRSMFDISLRHSPESLEIGPQVIYSKN